MTSMAQKGERAKWQSRMLIFAVVPACAIAVLLFSLARWNHDTESALAISLLFGVTAWRTRAATPAAAVTGGVLAAAMILVSVAAGLPWWHSPLWSLLSLFLLTFSATRFGRSRKEKLGIAEPRKGRNAAQVVANLGMAAWMGAIGAVMSLFERIPARTLSLLIVMLIAALAEATADTISSEIGEVSGGRPFLITTGRRVNPGTDGAISVTGTFTGALAAAIVILIALGTASLTGRAALAAFLAAFGGLFVDSLLGATLECSNTDSGCLNNDAVNFLSTVAASLLALGLFLL